MRRGIDRNEVLCVHMDISCNFHQIIFSENATNPLTHWSGAAKPKFWSFLDNKCKFQHYSDVHFLMKWGPNFTCWRKIPIIPGRGQFSYTPYRECSSCVWKLSLEGFDRYLRQQYATQGISFNSVISF